MLISGAVIIAAIAFSSHGLSSAGKNGTTVSPEKKPSVESEDGSSEEEDELPGIPAIISSVVLSQDTTKEVGKLGTSCEAVLVGQRTGVKVPESDLNIGEVAAASVVKLENQSLGASEGRLRMTDQDYETLLRIVEAESGTEEVKGRIMVANVIFNRMAHEEFPNTVQEVVWENVGGSPQFSPTADGRIYTVTVSEETREAVNRAIDGEDYSQGALFFMEEAYSDNQNVAWFKNELKFLFEYGVHDFYTYP